MAQQDTGPETTPMTNGSGDNGGIAQGGETQVSVLAQYVKDLSVENPSAPAVFQWTEQAQLDVQFNIQVDKIADEVHEVVLKIDVSARSSQGVHFVIDLAYGGLFGLRNVPEEAMGPFFLIEAPRILFPFARQIVAESVSGMGFPPLLLDPVDFTAAYMQQLQAAEAAGGETGGTPGGTGAGSETPVPAETESDA